jgi:hypothetical protein
MASNRESVIVVKGASFKEEETKFHMTFRYDFGTAECKQRIEGHKALGLEIGDNCLVLTHDFETNEAAQQAVDKLIALKPILEPLQRIELIKASGKTLIAQMGISQDTLNKIPMLAEFASAVGDFASINQFVSIDLKASRDLKDMFCDPTASPLALGLDSMCLKLTLSARKEMPVKIADFVATRLPASQQPKVKLIGRGVSAFHHLTYNVDLKSLNEEMRTLMKADIELPFHAGAQSFYAGLVQLGLFDVLKSSSTTTKVTFCVSPLLSFDFSLYAPKTLEVLQAQASPAPEIAARPAPA